jgi:elongation factor P
MEYLYSDGTEYHFMNTENYEQTSLTAEDLGGAASYLLPNVKIMVEFFESKALGVELPKTMDFAVTETAPGIKGANRDESAEAGHARDRAGRASFPRSSIRENLVRVDTSERRVYVLACQGRLNRANGSTPSRRT